VRFYMEEAQVVAVLGCMCGRGGGLKAGCLAGG
jgi:hypothetical protein